jgi:hypothetical protein
MIHIWSPFGRRNGGPKPQPATSELDAAAWLFHLNATKAWSEQERHERLPGEPAGGRARRTRRSAQAHAERARRPARSASRLRQRPVRRLEHHTPAPRSRGPHPRRRAVGGAQLASLWRQAERAVRSGGRRIAYAPAVLPGGIGCAMSVRSGFRCMMVEVDRPGTLIPDRGVVAERPFESRRAAARTR